MEPKTYIEENSALEYVKTNATGKCAVVMLHGYGANMFDLYPLGDYLRIPATTWYFPNAPIGLEMGFGYMSRAWFPIDVAGLEAAMARGEHRRLNDYHPVELDQAIGKMQQFIDSLLPQYDEIILGGFSQGAMLASHVAMLYPGYIKKLICFSGNPVAAESLLAMAQGSPTKLKFFQSHGKSDPILGYSGAKELFELLKLAGHQGEFVSFAEGHEIPELVLQKCRDFILN